MNIVTWATRFGSISVTDKTLPHVLDVAMILGIFVGVMAGMVGVLAALR